MANQFASPTDATNSYLKTYFMGPIKDEFNDKCPLYRAAELGKMPFSGLKVVRPLRLRRNQGYGATDASGATLPSSGKQGLVQAEIQSKYLYMLIGVTASMMKASNSDKGAFVRSLSYETEQAMKDFIFNANRALNWDGTGTLALLSANAVASSTITISGRRAGDRPDRFIGETQVIDIVSSSGVYKAQGITINSITVSGTNATVVLNSPVTASSGDYIVPAGTFNNEPQGLLYSMDGGTSTIYAVDRSLYRQYRGNVLNAGGQQLTFDLLQQTINQVRDRGGDDLSAWYTNFDGERFYQKLLTPQIRYEKIVQGDGAIAAKGQNYLDCGGIPVVPDKDMDQAFYCIGKECLEKYILQDMEVASESGSALIPEVSADRFQSRIRFFFNMFNAKPAAMGRLHNYISP